MGGRRRARGSSNRRETGHVAPRPEDTRARTWPGPTGCVCDSPRRRCPLSVCPYGGGLQVGRSKDTEISRRRIHPSSERSD